MDCPCCRESLVRVSDMPEIKGWSRFGDVYCRPCGWVLIRETWYEDARVLSPWCPEHGDRGAARIIPVETLADGTL